MTRVSISEARENFSAFIRQANQGKGDVVVQNRGRPEAVIISYADYELLQRARETERRQNAIQALQRIADEVGAYNADLSIEEVEQLADEISHEAVERLREKNDIRFTE